MAAKNVGKIKCFSQVHIINPDGTLAGDSGVTGPNMITNLGIQQYLCRGICGTLAALSATNVQYMALGSTDATANASNCMPASNATGFVCEITDHNTLRHSITSAAFSSRTDSTKSATLFIYGTFATTDSFLTDAGAVLGGVALCCSASGGQIFCGNTFAGSACASNQAVNVTYQIQLG